MGKTSKRIGKGAGASVPQDNLILQYPFWSQAAIDLIHRHPFTEDGDFIDFLQAEYSAEEAERLVMVLRHSIRAFVPAYRDGRIAQADLSRQTIEDTARNFQQYLRTRTPPHVDDSERSSVSSLSYQPYDGDDFDGGQLILGVRGIRLRNL